MRLDRWFDLVGAVSRLREVRALAGFSRIEPYPVSGERIRDGAPARAARRSRRRTRNWLPAAEIRGEGIFLRFRTEAVDRVDRREPGVRRSSAALDRKSAAIAAGARIPARLRDHARGCCWSTRSRTP